MNFIESTCIVSVNIFIIITGYFMINKEFIKLSKVIQLIFITIFYGIAIYLILLLTNISNISIDSLLTFVKSITDSWFITTYVILFLCIPFINKLIKNLSKKSYRNLLIILIFFFSVWPSIWTFITVNDGGYGIINFLLMYLIGGYLKLYCNEKEERKK